MVAIFKHVCQPPNVKHATFSSCEAAYIQSVPTVAALLLALCWVLGPACQTLRPKWTQPFVQEYADDDLDDGVSKPKTVTSVKTLLLIAVGCTCVLVHVLLLAVSSANHNAGIVVGIVPWIITTGFLIYERPRTFSFLLILFYVLVLISELLSLAVEATLLPASRVRHAANQASALLSLLILLEFPFRETETSSNVGKKPSDDMPSPEDNLNLRQFLTVSWMWPLISTGKQQTLNEDDVWQLSYQFQHHRLHARFQKLSGSILRRLCFANAIDFVIISTIAILSLVAEYSLPLLLQRLLQAFGQPEARERLVWIFAILSLLARAAMAQLAVLNIWFGRRCYERSRGELIMAVYAKALARKNVVGSSAKDATTTAELLSEQNSKRNWLSRTLAKFNPFSSAKTVSPTSQYASVGKILNVVRGDIYEVAQRFWEVDRLLTVPLGIIFSSVLIWKLLGPSCFLGIVALIASQLLNYHLIKLSIALGKIRKAASDARIQSTSQYIEVIRHLRWYGWQNHWLTQVQQARGQEMNIRIKTMLLNAVIAFINAVSRALFPVAALFSYTYLAGNTLSIDLIFPALSLFSSLDARLMEVPDLITTLINAHISMQRINGFMAEPEIAGATDQAVDVVPTLVLKDADFAWPEQKLPVLVNLSLQLSPGLTIVTGKVGSGKTALLQCLLGELDLLKGTMHLPNEPVAYCSQTPWLQSMSIRDNILFFSHFDQERYSKVVDACELLPDFLNFKHADLSNIGENGIGLSGGQRARIALARAIYSHSRILLLDDPLSALDHQTAESIVQKLFKGSLVADRIVILVTHRLELVKPIAGLTINIENGTANPMQKLKQDQPDHSVAGITMASSSTDAPDADGMTTIADKFIEDERRAEWGVQARVYWTYIKAGGLQYWAIDVLVLTVARLVSFVYTWFIKAWGEAYGTQSLYLLATSTSLVDRLHPSSVNFSFPNLRNLPDPEDDVRPWLWLFLAISLLTAAITLLAWMIDIMIMYNAAKHLFSQVMIKVSHATFRFYDVTPIGRLMNRMTSDISTVDGTISQHFGRIALQVVTWVSSVIIIASITPAFLLFSVTLMLVFVYIFSLFLPASQSLRRLETVSLSPLFANFGELLQGLTTVRAFHAGRQFQDRIIAVVDKFQGMDHFFWSLQSWVSYRFQLLAAVSTFSMTIIALYLRLTPGLTAFALSIANMFVNSTNFLCRRYGELQMEFVSVERIEELLHLEQEPVGTVEPPAIWPRAGTDIVFQNVSIRYAPHLDPALDDIDLVIPGGSTVALVGRTGSGKSTLAQSLLGVVRPETGSIAIDKLSVDEVTIDSLRQRVTFVAQDPVLFTGTIRHNLDPLEQFSDEECAAVLSRICHRQGWTLTTTIEPGGRNISQGQRQLIGITRAVLRRSSIVILDEATASIDHETSMEIQSVLREELRHSTVVIIAHRVEAVRDADYAIILDHGKVSRQGPARELLTTQM